MSRAASAPAKPRRGSREVELSLVITDPSPEDVLRRLARLRKLDGYTLLPRGSERIVDRYFDTPDGALRKRGLALRLRATEGKTLIGLKGRQRSASTRTEDRFERERPFSAQAVEEVRRRIGVRKAGSGSAPEDGTSPDALLESLLGVRLIQRRETRRLLREVVDSREPTGPVLAELALDRVQFRLDGPGVRHYEVEVEAKRTGRGTEAVRVVAAGLRARYPDQLEEWPYGKLPTGRAIEDLLSKDGLNGLGPNGALTPEAYERIRRYLERRG